jgi:hypothetical protein
MASISLTRLAAVNNPFSSLKLTSRCTFDYVSKDLWDRSFILLLVTGGFFVPLSIILFAYSFILIKLSQRGRGLRTRTSDEESAHQQITRPGTFYFNQINLPNDARYRSGTVTTLDCNEDNNVARNIRRTEARATRTALLICIVFCSAWGPYALTAILSLFGFDYLVNAYTTSILGMLTKVAACINPLIYALSLSGYREKICSYVKCICPCDDEHHHLSSSSHPDQIRKKLSSSSGMNNRQRLQSNSIHRLDI